MQGFMTMKVRYLRLQEKSTMLTSPFSPTSKKGKEGCQDPEITMP